MEPDHSLNSHPGRQGVSYWISLFFDDAGHDLTQAETADRQSNIARLFRAHPGTRTEGIYRFYYPGSGHRSEDLGPLVNTAPTGVATSVTEHDDQSSLRHALYDLSQNFYQAPVGSIRNLALFGSGRGASLAWKLAILLARQGIPNPGFSCDRFLIGRDFHIRFMGLFDTLGTFGIGSSAANVAHLDPIPEEVGYVLHSVAAHERRAVFDLQSLRDSPTTVPAEHRQEILYPGMHSDVGGGYGRNDQGRGNTLARIPLNDMLARAISHGVPFPSLSELKVLDPALHQEFSVPDDLMNCYRDYCRRLPPETDLYRALAHHECLYFRWLRALLNDPAMLSVNISRVQRSRKSASQPPEPQHSTLPDPQQTAGTSLSVHDAGQRLQQAYWNLEEEFNALIWRQTWLEGGFPEFNAPDSAFHLKQDEQLVEQDVLYRHRGDWALVVKPLRSFERDMLTWMNIAEPLPETLLCFFSQYVHDAIAHTPSVNGDRYFQRRSLYFRNARPWRG